MSTPARPGRPRLHRLVERIGSVEALDRPAEAVAKAVRSALGAGAVKDALSGTPLGHPLHPVITDVAIGSWVSALMLDLVGGRDARPGADRLVGLGLLAAVPTAASGLSDWADTTVVDPSVRRIGAAHAATNVGALALYAASLRARRAGRRGAGVALGLAGAGALTAGGHLGGHLSYAKGVGIDQTAFTSGPPEWRDAAAEEAVAEGSLHAVTVDGQQVLVTRRGGRLYALAARCAHRGGPLQDGELVDGCVQCPWHGSRFLLEDGSVERGPAAYPQPVYAVRVRDGRIEVRQG